MRILRNKYTKMTGTNFLNGNRFLFFFSRLLILAGMVLVFTSIFSLVGVFFMKWTMGVDLIKLTEALDPAAQSEQSKYALLFFQAFAGSIGTFLVPALLFPNAIGRKAVQFIRVVYPFKMYYLLVAPLLIVAAMPLISWLNVINQGFTFPEKYKAIETSLRAMETQAEAITKILVQSHSIGGFFISLLVVAILPAITEEFFFRGVLQNFTRICFYNNHLAIWFTAIIFSGIHGQFFGFVPRVVLGAGLGYLYLYSGNIWVVVLAHFVNNALALIAFNLSLKYPDVPFFSDQYQFPIWMTVLSFLSIVLFFYWQNKLQYRQLFHE